MPGLVTAFLSFSNGQRDYTNRISGVVQGPFRFTCANTGIVWKYMAVFSIRKSHRHRSQDEKERFYLLPGQGGSSYRRKQRFILKSAIVVGVVVSALLAALMFLLYRPVP